MQAIFDMAEDDGHGRNRAAWATMVEDLELRFVAYGADRQKVELVPGGRDMPVSWTARHEYLRMVKRLRLGEARRHCDAIARGMATQVPRFLLSLFTWRELEEMVCGPPEIDVGQLETYTVYGEGLTKDDPSVRRFWSVMRGFTPEEQTKYVRFVWGRSRLPVSVEDWGRRHQINRLKKKEPDKYLPIAHTCFFTLDLPEYSSRHTCKKKLLYAITHCIAIDADNTTVARQAAAAAGHFDDED